MFYKVACVKDFSVDEINAFFSKLSSSQRNYIGQKTGLKFKQSVVARILVSDLLSEHFGVLDGYNLSLDEKNRTHYNNDEFYLSISHSDDFIACAVSDKKVGIDIQVYKKVSDSLIKKVCTEEEIADINSTDNKQFINLWTVKEAYAKHSGKPLYEVFKTTFGTSGNYHLLNKGSPEIFNYSTKEYALTIIE